MPVPAFRQCRPSTRLCKLAMVMICVIIYVLSGTKYASLRLTSLDMELQGLKKHQPQNEATNNNSRSRSSSSSNNENDKECFWYSDNLYHLLCAVLTDRPIQFHVLTNRVPKMHRELFRLLDVQRCGRSSSSSKPLQQNGAGWEDLERNLPQVRNKLQRIQNACRSSQNDYFPTSNSNKKKCLHLARNFNRRLKNCTTILDQCDTVIFGDTVSFCQLWNVVQEYHTVVSPHGFQLVLPILAHSTLEVVGQGGNQSRQKEQQQQQQQQQNPQNTPAHIVEVRWPGYGDQSYQQLARIFSIDHTLLYGETPNGKLNNADNECVTIKECRKSERKRDIFCTADTQQQLEYIVNVL
jgi:hypothetical protein